MTAVGWAVWAVGMALSADYFVRASGRGSSLRLLVQAAKRAWLWTVRQARSFAWWLYTSWLGLKIRRLWAKVLRRPIQIGGAASMTAAASSVNGAGMVTHPQGLDAIPSLWGAVDGLRTDFNAYKAEHAELHKREWARADDTAKGLSQRGLAGLILVAIGTLLIGVD